MSSTSRWTTLDRSCHEFSQTGVWSKTQSLTETRESHVSWRAETGLILMGGVNSENTAEVVTAKGQGFPLEYGIR